MHNYPVNQQLSHHMQQPHHNNSQKPLPYIPLSFILTQTIGLQKQQKSTKNINPNQNIQLPNDHKYKDILIPINICNQNDCDTQMIYLYYLYHIAPIYNWLRSMEIIGGNVDNVEENGRIRNGCFQRNMLEDYVQGSLIYTKNNKKFKNTSENTVFSVQILLKNLNYCCTKFQIVKRCLMCKIFITKSNASSISPTSLLSKKLASSTTSNFNACKHNLKLSISTTSYHYQKQTKQLIITSYYCKQCQRNIQVQKNQYKIEEYPFAPIFNTYYEQNISVKVDQNKEIIYKLCMVYMENYVVIKAANQLWYRGDFKNISKDNKNINNSNFHVNGEMKIQNLSNFKFTKQIINKKGNCLFVYVREQMSKNCGILKLASKLRQKPISAIKIHKKQKIRKQAENVIMNIQSIKSSAKQKQNKRQKTIQKKSQMQDENQIDNNFQQLTQLKSQNLIKNTSLHLNIVSPEIATQYKQQVQKLYIKPKQKDEYEKDYDRGKTKKIKKKVQYNKPDFNSIFKEVKIYNKQLIEGKRQPERGKKKKIQNTNNGDGKNLGNFANKNNSYKGNFNKKGGNQRKGGKFGGRQAAKKWKKRQKQQFVKKFQES